MGKAADQPSAGIHGEEDESSFGLSSFIQFRENAAQAKAAFGNAYAALNTVALT